MRSSILRTNGADKFIGGICDLLIGPSEDVFMCWNQHNFVQDPPPGGQSDEMCYWADECESSTGYPQPGCHGCGGPALVFPEPGPPGPTPTPTSVPPTATSTPTPTPGGEEIIIDNGDPETSFTGTWSTSSATDFYGTDSLYSDATTETYRWTPNIGTAGNYEVYAWWTYHTNRVTNVPYEISYNGGTDTVIVNQNDQSLSGQWNLLGTYNFVGGSSGYVEVSGENGQACADAVRFVRVD
jgi:hypothetical protein